jgi:hypothetical protein
MGVFMKMKQFLLYFGFLALLFCSCDLSSGGVSIIIENPVNVQPRKFWAQNVASGTFYQVDAVLLAESENCRVWAEREARVGVDAANIMARAYEQEILPKMLDTYGIKGNIVYEGQNAGRNTMEFADWLGDGDGKLCILLLDIKDSFSPGIDNSYVAGYFMYANFLGTQRFQYSNLCDMIYIDTYPSTPGNTQSNATFAHEMQHMMNFVTSVKERSSGNNIYLMDLWVDEGLSSAAEWLYLGEQVGSKVNDYNNDLSGLIKTGNNFFVWGNRGSENPYAVLDDYSTVYLFFQWLRLQAGRSDIYYDIITSGDYDFRAVTNAANKYMAGRDYSNWGTLLKTWLAANYINAPSGPYGYRNDAALKNIRAKTVPAGVRNVSLAPGEGVYSITGDFAMPSSNKNIRYAGLNKDGNALSDTSTFSGGALLTYNANTDNVKGAAESGTTTGAASYEAAGRSALGSAAAVNFSGPFAIGAWDMLRRNGFEEKPFLELSGLKKGSAVLE